MHSRARAHARKNDSTYEMIAHATNARAREKFLWRRARRARVGIDMNKQLIKYSSRVPIIFDRAKLKCLILIPVA